MRKAGKNWDVIKISAKGMYLGRVLAPDEKSALKAAIKELKIKPTDQKRVIVRPS